MTAFKKMKSTKVKTLGELGMRGAAKLMGWAAISMRLLVVSR